MTEDIEKSRLKVCCTCSFWSYQFKGFCHRLEQGVGKFWRCQDWSAVSAETEESLPDTPKTIQVRAMMG